MKGSLFYIKLILVVCIISLERRNHCVKAVEDLLFFLYKSNVNRKNLEKKKEKVVPFSGINVAV